MPTTPTKSVHWARENEVYEHASTSSPASTSSTLSSSPGPLTPQSFSSSFGDGGSLTVHDVLRLGKVDYKFDVSVDPAKMPSSSSLTSDILKEDASSPPLKCVRITHRYLPWELEVIPSDMTSSSSCVTVSDVLGGLYRALRLSVTEEEFEESGSSSVDEAFKKRCDRFMERSVRDAENERKKGRKRVDFLRSKLVFCGFTVEEGKLRLHVK